MSCRAFKCLGDEYTLSSVCSEGASRTSTTNLKATKITICKDFIVWNVNDTVYISRSDSIGKASSDSHRFLLSASDSSDAHHQEPSKSIVFSQRPTCHAYMKVESGPDLLIGFADGSVALLSIKAQIASTGNKPIMASTILLPTDSGQQAQDKENQSKCTSVHWVPRSDVHYILIVVGSTCYVSKRPVPAAEPALKEVSKSSFSLSLRSSSSSSAASEKSMQPVPVGLFAIPGNGVNESQISPDSTKLAVGCKDGTLRILDISNDVICPPTVGGFRSYYGSILCVSWSADSRYVAAGSEDDLVTVYGLSEKCPVAHCEGHQSWISSIAFDSLSSVKGLCRLVSVGQDAQVCFWDVEVGEAAGVDSASALPSPLGATMRKVGSQMSLQQLGWQGQQESTESPKGNSFDLKKSSKKSEGASVILDSVKRIELVLYEPLVTKRIHMDPVSSCVLSQGALITADCLGHLKVWEKKSG